MDKSNLKYKIMSALFEKYLEWDDSQDAAKSIMKVIREHLKKLGMDDREIRIWFN